MPFRNNTLSCLLLLGLVSSFGAAFQPFSSQVQEMEVKPLSNSASTTSSSSTFNPYNDTSFARNLKRNVYRAPDTEEREEEARRRRARARERRAKAKEYLATLSETASSSTTSSSKVQRLTKEQVDNVARRTSWFGNSGSVSYNAALQYLADPSQDYDKWAQAYRMLGAFIDCDHDWSEGSQDQGGDNNNNNNGGDNQDHCARWMMWASVSFLVATSVCLSLLL
mgnify:CR=1 FL=1